MDVITGQCLCGSVSYALAHPPLRTTLCSCHFCQRVTGALQAVIHVAPLSAVDVTRGAPAVYSHRSTGSGQLVHLHSCPACATRLFMTYDRWPDFAGIYDGTLDDPARIGLDPATTKQIFVASARPETVLMAGIPAFWEHSAALDGTPQVPFVLDRPTAVRDLAGRDLAGRD